LQIAVKEAHALRRPNGYFDVRVHRVLSIV
jgi:hypothetical protein